MKRPSKGFYVTVLAGGPVVSLAIYLLLLVLIGMQGPVRDPTLSILAGLGYLLMLAGIVSVAGTLVYRMWAAIQDGHARMTPREAVGFQFIVFFNIYWMFQVFWGFAKDYNAHVRRHPDTGPRRGLSESLFLTYPILVVVVCAVWTAVSYFSYAALLSGSTPAFALLGITSWLLAALALITYGFWIAVVVKICDAVNALPGEATGPSEVASGAFALYCASGEFAGRSVPLPEAGIVIGRSPAKSHLVLVSTNVSAAHVHVWPDSHHAGVWVKDMESTNGTYYQNGHGTLQSTWEPIREPKFLGRHSSFRLGQEGGAEFEVR